MLVKAANGVAFLLSCIAVLLIVITIPPLASVLEDSNKDLNADTLSTFDKLQGLATAGSTRISSEILKSFESQTAMNLQNLFASMSLLNVIANDFSFLPASPPPALLELCLELCEAVLSEKKLLAAP